MTSIVDDSPAVSERRPPIVSVFVDERVESDRGHHLLIVTCVVVGASRWKALHATARRVGQIRGRRRLDEIGKLLGKIGGFALVTYGDLPAELVPAGEVDGTDDIPRMARSDNVWSQAVLAAGTAVLAYLPRHLVPAAELDFYTDPKDLTAAHRAAFEQTLREKLPEIAREAPPTPWSLTPPRFSIGPVRQVPKRARGTTADALQLGTDVAHHLCSQANALIAGRVVPRIYIEDHTEARVHMVSHFLGDAPVVSASGTGDADTGQQPIATDGTKPGSRS